MSQSRSRRQKWRPIIGNVVLFSVILLAINLWQTRQHIDGAAPATTLRALEGSTHQLGAGTFEGTTVVYFFAPWCGVCGLVGDVIDDLRADSVRTVAVALAYDSKAAVAAFRDEHGIETPVLLGNDDIMQSYRIGAFPTFYVINAAGDVTASTVGYTTSIGLWLRVMLFG